MLMPYIQAALRHASYEILSDDGSFYGEIPVCNGVYANAATLEECRTQLVEVLEEWISSACTSISPFPSLTVSNSPSRKSHSASVWSSQTPGLDALSAPGGV